MDQYGRHGYRCDQPEQLSASSLADVHLRHKSRTFCGYPVASEIPMECGGKTGIFLSKLVSNRFGSYAEQIAITKFFDGETPDPVEEARAALNSSPIRTSSERRETLLDGSSNFPRSSTSPSRSPAPRIVLQPEDRNVYKAPVLVQILLTPFNLIYRLLSGSLGLFGYLFPFLPRILSSLSRRSPVRSSMRNTTGRRPLGGRDTAARFARVRRRVWKPYAHFLRRKLCLRLGRGEERCEIPPCNPRLPRAR